MDHLLHCLNQLDCNNLNSSDTTALLEAMYHLKNKLLTSQPIVENSTVPTTAELCEKFTSTIDNFLPSDLLSELKSGLKSVKFQSQSHTNTSEVALFGPYKYVYNHATQSLKPTPMDELSPLQSIIDKVNLHFNADFNSVLINKYRNKNVALGFHKDNEECIEQDTSVLTLSVGATRKMAFCTSKEDNVNLHHHVELTENKMLVMYPGCQQALYHSVLRASSQKEFGIRYSLTFRQMKNEETDHENHHSADKESSPISAISDSLPKNDTRNKILIVGSSLARGLNSDKITGNRGKTCEVVYRSGAHLPDVIRMLENYKFKSSISDVVVVAGGNDVGNCANVGLSGVLRDYERLASVLIHQYSDAKIYLIGLMPRKLRDPLHLQRLTATNNFLRSFCGERGFRLLERFSHYLLKSDKGRENKDISISGLNPDLYKEDFVHHTVKGVTVLAKVIIGAIFYPR